jgi:pimeloyl-ACP methyl ester carboxylesterase
MEHITVKAGDLHLTGIAAGTGHLVLMLHGFPETAEAWRHQVKELAGAGHRAVALNLPGYADSNRPTELGRYRLDALVETLVAVLDAWQVADCTVVGNDWGSTLAWAAAQLRPDRFRAVMAIGVPMMGRPPAPPSQIFPQTDEALFYTLYFQTPGLAETEFEADIPLTLRKILHAASAAAGKRQPGDGTPNSVAMVPRRTGLLPTLPDRGLPSWLRPEDFDRWVAAFAKSGFTGGLNYYRSLDANWQVMPETPVTVPAAFLIGAQDPGLAVPGMAQIIAGMGALVPRLKSSEVIADCGHWVTQEQPEAVNRLLLAFLAQEV